uniref:Uncharacterized protein n=1 Tax=Lepeophtheirus salmonis TaxID=72036 RepID=A0A0K2UNC4_LEPSM
MTDSNKADVTEKKPLYI